MEFSFLLSVLFSFKNTPESGTIFDSFPYIWELGAPILKEIIEIFLNVFPEFTGCGNKILGEEVIQKYNLLCKKPLC